MTINQFGENVNHPAAVKLPGNLAGGSHAPQDVGRAVAMLARRELTYATGNVLAIDGGLTLRRL